MEAVRVCSYETSVDYQRIKRNFFPEDKTRIALEIVDWIPLTWDMDKGGLCEDHMIKSGCHKREWRAHFDKEFASWSRLFTESRQPQVL
jgi:hypothetical protein